MSEFVLCRVCLAQNIEMYPVNKTKFRDIYEKQTGTTLITDSRFQHVCYVCNALLLRFQNFLQMSQETEQFLIKFCESGVELTPDNIKTLSTNHLSTKTSLNLTEDTPDPKEVETPTSTVEDVAIKIESVDYDDEYEQKDSYLIEDCNKEAEVNTIEIEVPKPVIKISDIRVKLERLKLPTNGGIGTIKTTTQLLYPCSICNQRFYTKSLLIRHRCTQPCTKNKLRCILCDRWFRQRSMYLVHQRTHTGEKPYKCEMCDRVFNDRSNCRKHMRTHLNIKYSCQLCDRAFSERRYLLKHSVTHIL